MELAKQSLFLVLNGGTQDLERVKWAKEGERCRDYYVIYE